MIVGYEKSMPAFRIKKHISIEMCLYFENINCKFIVQ